MELTQVYKVEATDIGAQGEQCSWNLEFGEEETIQEKLSRNPSMDLQNAWAKS